MLKQFILAGIATVIFTTTAYASNCPNGMAKIDAILPTKMSKMSADDVAKVKSLRTKGEAEHKAGNHDASVKSLAEAMNMLGIK